MGITPLQPALIDMLMDAMVAACQNAKNGEKGVSVPNSSNQRLQQAESARALSTVEPNCNDILMSLNSDIFNWKEMRNKMECQ